MTTLFEIDTEQIHTLLDNYLREFVTHPLFVTASSRTLPRSILTEFATHQYADSVVWIPMLALMRAKAVRSKRLQRAIEENIACEAGLGGTSHVALARNLMRSLGVDDTQWRLPSEFEGTVGWFLSEEFESFGETEIAGWLLVAETLVPVMFEKMIKSFEALPNCDTRYFSEHVHVDDAEHAKWMLESVHDVIAQYRTRESVAGVLRGMEDAWMVILEVPNLLCERIWRLG